MKHLFALFTALIITAVIGLGVLIIGVSAFTNQNTVAIQNTANTNAAVSSVSTSSDVEQLRQQVSDLQTQLDQATQAVQQYQSLILALQQRGVISISEDGRVFILQNNTSNTH
jgi:peptidoglycan hydrolase CwlO-like protein